MLSPRRPVRSLQQSTAIAGLEAARSCYDHLAGRLGVQVRDALVQTGAIERTSERDFDATRSGAELLNELGVDVSVARRQRRRVFLRDCLDWTMRRPHLAGSLAAAVLTVLIEQGELVRRPSSRGLDLSGKGAVLARLGVELPRLGAADP